MEAPTKLSNAIGGLNHTVELLEIQTKPSRPLKAPIKLTTAIGDFKYLH